MWVLELLAHSLPTDRVCEKCWDKRRCWKAELCCHYSGIWTRLLLSSQNEAVWLCVSDSGRWTCWCFQRWNTVNLHWALPLMNTAPLKDGIWYFLLFTYPLTTGPACVQGGPMGRHFDVGCNNSTSHQVLGQVWPVMNTCKRVSRPWWQCTGREESSC